MGRFKPTSTMSFIWRDIPTTLFGTFAGLNEGAVFNEDLYYFRISYDMVDGSDTFIGLTVVPEPGAAGLAFPGLILLTLRRRVRRT